MEWQYRSPLDEFARALKNGDIMDNNIFELMKRSDDGEIVKVK